MRELENRMAGKPPRPRAAPRPFNGTGVLPALALVVSLVGVPFAAAQEAMLGDPASSSGVHYDAERDRLSVSVTDQPVVSLFEEISSQAGVRLVVHGTDHGLISADFRDLPLETGIKRLLHGRSHVISHDAEAKGQMMVWILSSPDVVAKLRQGRSQTAANRQGSRSSKPSAKAPGGAEKTGERKRRLRNLYLGEGAENALPDLLEELGSEKDIIRDAIANGQLPEQLIDALGEGAGR